MPIYWLYEGSGGILWVCCFRRLKALANFKKIKNGTKVSENTSDIHNINNK
jgi:hypothetical protein